MLIAILFALAKAALIASIFMHALYEGRLVKLAIAGACLVPDSGLADLERLLTRGWLGFGGK